MRRRWWASGLGPVDGNRPLAGREIRSAEMAGMDDWMGNEVGGSEMGSGRSMEGTAKEACVGLQVEPLRVGWWGL